MGLDEVVSGEGGGCTSIDSYSPGAGRVEADMEVACGVRVEGGIGDAAVAEAFQRTPGDVLEAAEEGDDVCFRLLLGKLFQEGHRPCPPGIIAP